MSTQTGNENCVSIGYYTANVSAIYVYTFSLSFSFREVFCVYFEMDFKLAILLALNSFDNVFREGERSYFF